MKRLPKEEIQKMVSDAVKTFPCDYRCYEITRALKKIFLKKGLSSEVKDGYAFYCFNTFLKEANMKNCQLFLDDVDKSDELIKAARFATSLAIKNPNLERDLYWRIGVRHSWMVLPGEKYLIDYHQSISPNDSPFPIFLKFPILRKISVGNILIINPFNKIPKGKGYFCGDIFYWEEAVQEGNVIYYPNIDYSVELSL